MQLRPRALGSPGLVGRTYLGVPGCVYAFDARTLSADGSSAPNMIGGANFLQPTAANRYAVAAGPPQYAWNDDAPATTPIYMLATLNPAWRRYFVDITACSFVLRYYWVTTGGNFVCQCGMSSSDGLNFRSIRERAPSSNAALALNSNAGVQTSEGGTPNVPAFTVAGWHTLGLSTQANGLSTWYQDGVALAATFTQTNQPSRASTENALVGMPVTQGPATNSRMGFATGWYGALTAAQQLSLHTQFAAVYA